MSLALAIAALLLLRLGWLTPRAALAVAASALLLALVAGLTLPDIDQPLPLDHRSALTHSAAPALLLTVRRWAWPAAAGVALGTGIHLSADLFPNAMIGFATVKMPFAGSIGAGPSYAWLAANAIACLAIGGLAIRQRFADPGWRRGVAAAAAAIGAVYLATVDGGWPAFALLLALAWLGLGRPFLASPRASAGRPGSPA